MAEESGTATAPPWFRGVLVGAGIITILIGIFGTEIRAVINFPSGPADPDFGPLQWVFLVVGALLLLAGLVFPAQIYRAVRR